MKLNDALPEIEVDPETYEVRADGELLRCDARARPAARAALLPVLMRLDSGSLPARRLGVPDRRASRTRAASRRRSRRARSATPGALARVPRRRALAARAAALPVRRAAHDRPAALAELDGRTTPRSLAHVANRASRSAGARAPRRRARPSAIGAVRTLREHGPCGGRRRATSRRVLRRLARRARRWRASEALRLLPALGGARRRARPPCGSASSGRTRRSACRLPPPPRSAPCSRVPRRSAPRPQRRDRAAPRPAAGHATIASTRGSSSPDRSTPSSHDAPASHDHGHRTTSDWHHPGHFAERDAPAARATSPRAPFTVGIGGPVGSGKTALVLALCRALRERHRSASSPTTSSRARTPSS